MIRQQSGSLELTFICRHSHRKPGLNLCIPGLPSVCLRISMCLGVCFVFNSAQHLTPRETRHGFAVRGWLISEEGGCPYQAPPGEIWSWKDTDQFHGENDTDTNTRNWYFNSQFIRDPHIFTLAGLVCFLSSANICSPWNQPRARFNQLVFL